MSDGREIVDDAERALGHVREAFPALDAQEAHALDAGWFSYAYIVDDTWVFRFPLTDDPNDAEHAYRKERLLLPRLAPAVAVAVPEIQHVALLPDGRTFMGHRAIQGEPLTVDAVHAMTGEALDTIARQIAEFLRAVHAFPIDEAREIGVDEEELCDEYEQYREDARRRVYPSLTATQRELCDGLLHQFLSDPGNFEYDTCVTHADMRGRHVLLDSTPRVAGIIDYGCVCMGDPDYDFFPLQFDAGEELTRRLLDHYGHGDPDRALRKGQFFAAVDAIDTWLTGLDERCDWKLADGRTRLLEALLA